MGKTKLRSWEDEFYESLDNLVKEKIGITFSEYLETSKNMLNLSKYNKLGSLEVFIPINRLYTKTVNSDIYRWWKKYYSYDDCYYFVIRREDGEQFLLNLIYLDFHTNMYILTDSQSNDYFFEIYGSNNYYDFTMLYSVYSNSKNINKKFHIFNSNNIYKYYIIRIPLEFINTLNLLNISLFNMNLDGILYTKDSIVKN